MKAMYALGGLSAAWDAAIDRTIAPDLDALSDIDDEAPLADSDCEAVQSMIDTHEDDAIERSRKRKRMDDEGYEPPQAPIDSRSAEVSKRASKRRRNAQLDKQSAALGQAETEVQSTEYGNRGASLAESEVQSQHQKVDKDASCEGRYALTNEALR